MRKGDVDEGLVYHAGFPNAGEDQQGQSLSLDKLIVRHRTSTFFWRLESAVAELHWPAGTIVVVDRSLPARDGRLVVAIVDEAFMIARYRKKGFYDISGESLPADTRLWGMITYVIQAL